MRDGYREAYEVVSLSELWFVGSHVVVFWVAVQMMVASKNAIAPCQMLKMSQSWATLRWRRIRTRRRSSSTTRDYCDPWQTLRGDWGL